MFFVSQSRFSSFPKLIHLGENIANQYYFICFQIFFTYRCEYAVLAIRFQRALLIESEIRFCPPLNYYRRLSFDFFFVTFEEWTEFIIRTWYKSISFANGQKISGSEAGVRTRREPGGDQESAGRVGEEARGEAERGEAVLQRGKEVKTE